MFHPAAGMSVDSLRGFRLLARKLAPIISKKLKLQPADILTFVANLRNLPSLVPGESTLHHSVMLSH